jgi:hypothetical protein
LLSAQRVRMPEVEPGSQAWEACMMPLHYMRFCLKLPLAHHPCTVMKYYVMAWPVLSSHPSPSGPSPPLLPPGARVDSLPPAVCWLHVRSCRGALAKGTAPTEHSLKFDAPKPGVGLSGVGSRLHREPTAVVLVLLGEHRSLLSKASAGNRDRVTSMATMYSTARPSMLCS